MKFVLHCLGISAPIVWLGLAVGIADSAEPAVGDQDTSSTQPATAKLTSDEIAFFEQKIRPVLASRCYECHSEDAEELQGGLRVDLRETLARGGDSGPAIVPGDPEESLLIQSIRYDALEMPPDEKLSDHEIADFEKWVAMGAPDPRAGDAAPITPPKPLEGRDHWAFKPIEQPARPEVLDSQWPITEVDYFVLSGLERDGLTPAVDADRYTWLRRVSFDLAGLPPTVEEIKDFLEDDSPNAYERVVDRLLGSRSFGQRWSRYWLDLVGYADQKSAEAPMYAQHAWRYRDFVIDSINRDVPFDHFTRQQIAGDKLPYDSVEERRENLIATGYLVLGASRISDYDKMQLHVDTLDAQVSKIGQTFLGMTLGCARCHDHKFDPIPRDDYYAIAGILDSTYSLYRTTVGVWSEIPDIELPETEDEKSRRIDAENEQARKIVRMNAQLVEHRARLKELDARLKEDDERRKKEREAEEAAKKETPKDEASEKGQEDKDREAADNEKPSKGDDSAPLLAEAEKKSNDGAGEPKPEGRLEKLRKERDELRGKAAKLKHRIDHAELFVSQIPMASGVRDTPQPADMRITIRGNPRALGAAVPRGVLSVLPTTVSAIPEGESGRMQLADWLASPDNPLTPRVTVNRIWQKLIGVGLKENVDYFGIPEPAPTHPQLLDYLATTFMDNDWSRKRLIRMITLSRTYRMSSQHNSRAHELDPNNQRLWRMNRSRMDAEALRDAIISAGGKLRRSDGGPAVPFEIPDNVSNIGTGKIVVNPAFFSMKKYRPGQEYLRTVYLPIIRGPNQPEMADLRNVFDFTSPSQTAGQRNVTTVPTQALYLMNSPQVKSYANDIAERIQSKSEHQADRLDFLWLTVLNRPITDLEQREASEFLEQSGEQAWQELCHALIASGEFLMRS